MGKTALATNIAYNVADWMYRDRNLEEKSRGVAFFSLEMSADQLATRVLSSAAGISSQKMRNGDIDNGEFERIAEVVRSLEKMPLYIDDTPGLTINAIRNRARRLKRSKGLGLIVIDYIQLITGSASRGRSQPRAGTVGNFPRAENHGQGTERAGNCPVTAQPRGRNARRQAAGDV